MKHPAIARARKRIARVIRAEIRRRTPLKAIFGQIDCGWDFPFPDTHFIILFRRSNPGFLRRLEEKRYRKSITR